MIDRALQPAITSRLAGDDKAIIVYGARQVGKTTMINALLSGRTDVLRLNGDASDVRKMLEEATPARWRQLLGPNKILFLDEAQRITDIGIKLKLITDELPGIKIIASGSSSFELANRINEPLTGRKWEFCLTPLSFQELVAHHGLLEERRELSQRLVFGAYPEIVTHPDEARDLLRELTSSYLYQDILNRDLIKKSDKLDTLLRALALQVSSQVSFNELAQLCELDNKTIEKYVDILEQAFIIFRLPSFSRNLRHELRFSRKIYFYDNGIRNALLGDFALPEVRHDVGQLWENYLVSERHKYNLNTRSFAKEYFWRTAQQQEIDYVEERGDHLAAYEFKWNPKARQRSCRSFCEAYGVETVPVITPDNYDTFLLPPE